MSEKLKLKKRNFHPVITMFIIIILIILISGILSFFEVQANYNSVNAVTGQLESNLVSVKNLFNYDGLKYIISNAAKNFASFTPLTTLLLSLIGMALIQSSGLLDTVLKNKVFKLSNQTITFLLVFIATISTLINDVGYIILIPLGAMLFMNNKRNPQAGIIASFAAVSFGYGATIFVGSMEVSLIPYTTLAARLVDQGSHISLTSNLFIIIISSIILSMIGTIIVEKKIVPMVGRYKNKKEEEIIEVEIIDEEAEEQKKLETELYEKKGLKRALIAFSIILFIFIYSLLPNLPFSGLLLDMNEKTYLNQLFGPNSYFQDGFTFLVTILFVTTGVSYGLGSKTFKGFNDMIQKTNVYLKDVGYLIIMLFMAAQLLSVFKQTNIGMVILAWGSNIISSLGFNGIPLILLVLLVIMITTIFVPTPALKWSVLSATVVPALMQSNVTPQFAQFMLRAGDSMTKGLTPLMAYFVIYIGYLNIYNLNKEQPVTIGQGIKYLIPYFIGITLTWIAIILIWYLIGFPIGPGVYPTA